MKRQYLGLVCALSFAWPAAAQDEKPPQTLFTNVHVFDGTSEQRIENASVLVEGNMIKTVSTEAIDAPDATVIDGEGRTLTPGFIENHAHLMMLPGPDPASNGSQFSTWEDLRYSWRLRWLRCT